MAYCIYVRKSRADAEAEARGEGETLARHITTLMELAKKRNYEILQIHKEVVSGETISARPVMQQLLNEVSKRMWDGVLVMEVERLARGDTTDQGKVAQAFKFSGTKIITPLKVYDPDNEFDEEYFEFGLFMSRREYKTINRRLQRGRMASVVEGKYCGSVAPYGYRRTKLSNDKGYTLEPIEEEANAVRLIFQLYTQGELMPDGTYRKLGVTLIAKRLNALHIRPKKNEYWTAPSVREKLTNPVYIGKIRWNWRKTQKSMINGQQVSSRPRSRDEDCMLANGLHQPIIDEKMFYAAQAIMNGHSIPSVNLNRQTKNPLAGIIVCGKCGHNMTRRPYPPGKGEDTILCSNIGCDNIGSSLRIVEQNLLSALKEWVSEYRLLVSDKSDTTAVSSSVEIKNGLLIQLNTERDRLKKQLTKAFDLVEQGVYDYNTFLERSRLLSDEIKQAEANIEKVEKEIAVEKAQETAKTSFVPKIKNILDVYDMLETPREKNELLKEVLEKVVYIKTTRRKRNEQNDCFELTLYPKIPECSKYKSTDQGEK